MKKVNYFCKYDWKTLVEATVKQVDVMLKHYDKWEEAEICDNLSHISELGHKLLENDYHSNSTLTSLSVDQFVKDHNLDEAIELDYKFARQYHKEHKELVKDLRKFYKLISKNVGEWD